MSLLHGLGWMSEIFLFFPLIANTALFYSHWKLIGAQGLLFQKGSQSVEILVKDATRHFPSPAQHVCTIAESQIPAIILFKAAVCESYLQRTGVFIC